jgi:DNA topoisomerase-1
MRRFAELGLRRITTDELTIAALFQMARASVFVDTRRAQPVNGAPLKRIKALTIPPAWKDVRIARDRQAHLQAVGRDDAGRLQYIYHSAWDDVRAVSKAYRLIEFGKALPRVRSAGGQGYRFSICVVPARGRGTANRLGLAPRWS